MLKGKNYCLLSETLAAHELIGLDVRIAASTDEGRKGIKGTVIDETKNVLDIQTRQGIKRIPKKEAEFEFMLGKEKALLNGSNLIARPEDRIKLFWRKHHGRM